MAAVNRNMFDASIITERPGGASLMVLPLNLIAQIVTNVEDTGDLARLCRTCRVLNYMALPQLYRSLTLTSYDKIRYRDEQPEGSGSSSPFTMGLNAVITRPFASLVRSMTLRGDWKEHDLEEHAQVGRVPDSSMLLNITVRAAIDRMNSLESFSWELNTKMLDTVYAGLTQLPKLHSLTIRFPSTRHPQPTHVLPPMPHLRALKITDIDPLCYPDDISTLLWKSKKLRDLKLHWSPRMRIAQEPSVSVHDYFRKSIAAKQPLLVKKLSFQNMYAFHSEEFNIAFDPTTVEDVSFLSGSDTSGLMNTFVENSWPTFPPHKRLKIKSFRMDAVSKRNAEFLGNFKGLERIYLVNVTADNPDYLNSPRPASMGAASALTPPISEHHNTGTAANSPANLQSPASQLNPILSGRDSYLSNITVNHGASLRHLLLSSKWPLSTAMIARLVHGCPNLEQLGLATDVSSMEALGMLLPFLRKLVALRLLIPAGSPPPQTGPSRGFNSPATHPDHPMHPFMKAKQAHAKAYSPTGKVVKIAPEIEDVINNARSLADIVDMDDDMLINMMSYDLADKQIFGNLKIMGMGWKSFELRGYYKAPIPIFEEETQTPLGETPGENGLSGNRANGAVDTPDGRASSKPTSPDIHTDADPTRIPPTSGVNMPPSTLGKRSRSDDDSGVSERQSSERPDQNRSVAQMCGNEAILTDDGQVWRRHMRRVGWDVLKNWEIWSLDAQEI